MIKPYLYTVFILIDAHPPSWIREIMISSGISPIIAHDDASFIRFSQNIYYWHQLDCSVARNANVSPGRPKSVYIGQQNS